MSKVYPRICLSAISAIFLFTGVASADSLPANCLLEIANVRYIDGACQVAVLGDIASGENGGLELQTSSSGRSVSASVIKDGTGLNGFWNGADHADQDKTPLGNLIPNKACWINETVKVCAWREGQTRDIPDYVAQLADPDQQSCDTIQNATDRLACYDKKAKPAPTQSPAPAPAPAPAPPKSDEVKWKCNDPKVFVNLKSALVNNQNRLSQPEIDKLDFFDAALLKKGRGPDASNVCVVSSTSGDQSWTTISVSYVVSNYNADYPEANWTRIDSRGKTTGSNWSVVPGEDGEEELAKELPTDPDEFAAARYVVVSGRDPINAAFIDARLRPFFARNPITLTSSRVVIPNMDRNGPNGRFHDYRTRLTEGLRDGSVDKFGGHFGIGWIGCGTDCGTPYVYDLMSGIIKSPTFTTNPASYGEQDMTSITIKGSTAIYFGWMEKFKEGDDIECDGQVWAPQAGDLRPISPRYVTHLTKDQQTGDVNTWCAQLQAVGRLTIPEDDPTP